MRKLYLAFLLLLIPCMAGCLGKKDNGVIDCKRVAPAYWGTAGNLTEFEKAREVAVCYDWAVVGKK